MKFSKIRKKALLSLALLISVIIAAISVSAYDGAADPIISLSYLRQYKTLEIDPQIAALQSEIQTLQATVKQLSEMQQGGQQPQTPVVDTTGYFVVQLAYGQTVRAGESCEMILRSGTASVVLDALSQGGISDLTAGADLVNGESVALNHLLLVPRADGRGISITSDIAYIMIKGAYSIE